MESYCGMNCERCLEYPHQCPGCRSILGAPEWAEGLGEHECPIFLCCAVKKHLSGCKDCHESICSIKRELAEG